MIPKFANLILALSVIIMACGEVAKDIPLTSIDVHVKYQDERMAKDSTYPIELINEYVLLAKGNDSLAEAYYLLGRVDLENREDHWERSLELNSDFYPALLGMAELGMEDDALGSLYYAERAIALKPDDWRASYIASMANLQLVEEAEDLKTKKNKLNNAFSLIEKFIKADSSNTYLKKINEGVQVQLNTIKKIEKEEANRISDKLFFDAWMYSDGQHTLLLELYPGGQYMIKVMSGRNPEYGSWDNDSRDIFLYMNGDLFLKGQLVAKDVLRFKGPKGGELEFYRMQPIKETRHYNNGDVIID